MGANARQSNPQICAGELHHHSNPAMSSAPRRGDPHRVPCPARTAWAGRSCRPPGKHGGSVVSLCPQRKHSGSVPVSAQSRQHRTRPWHFSSSITVRGQEREEGLERRQGESRHGGDGRQERVMPALAQTHKTYNAKTWRQKYPHVRVHVCHQHVQREKPAKAGAKGPAARAPAVPQGTSQLPPSQEAARYWWK